MTKKTTTPVIDVRVAPSSSHPPSPSSPSPRHMRGVEQMAVAAVGDRQAHVRGAGMSPWLIVN